MRNYFVIVGLLLGITSFNFSKSPDCSVELGAVFLKQLHPYKRSLAFRSSAPYIFKDELKSSAKDSISLNELVNSINPDWGFNAALQFFPNQTTTVELRYLGKLSWNGKKLEAHFIQKNEAHATHQLQCLYDSRFRNWECNAWHHITPRAIDYFSVSSFIGIRSFKMSDHIQIHFDAGPSYSEQLTFGETLIPYQVETNNFSLGLQIGGDIQCHPYSFLTWGIATKIGGMHNKNIKKITPPYQVFSHSNMSYLGEISPFVQWNPTKHFVFNVHYQALCIGGLTIGDRNIYFLSDFHDKSGHIIYHGFTGTIQFNF